MGLYRTKFYTKLHTLVPFLNKQIQEQGQLHGYRWMHLKCIQSGLIVNQETIRLALCILDPQGVKLRKRNRLRRRMYRNKGPNFLWHMDSYDKLKPYGIAINGCIDGFSRYIIWLKAARTNSNPKVIGVNSISHIGGCPRRIRADMGTENGNVSTMQTFILEDNYCEPYFIYGKSPANQRIEAWWSILRKHHAQFWMNFFQIMKEGFIFDGGFLDKSLSQFCFLNIIQKQLDEVVLEWNVHSIRRSKNSISPGGRPIILYETPKIYNTEDYKIIVTKEKIIACRDECNYLINTCDKEVCDLCSILMGEQNISFPRNPFEALDVYKFLRNEILNLL